MKKNIKKFITAFLFFSLFAVTVHAKPVQMTLTYDGARHNYNAESIDLYVNGNEITLKEMPPISLNGRTYVPSREVFEPLGAIVDWKAATKELYIGYEQSLIVMKSNSKTANVNGVKVDMENPPKIINDKLMIPARFVAEQFGIPVDWDAEKRIVYIGTKTPPIIVENPEPTIVENPVPDPTPTPAPTVPVPTQQPPAPVNVPGLSVDISTQVLTEIPLGDVSIQSVNLSGTEFTIAASGEISKVEKLLLPENKLVLDFYNANNSLSKSSLTFSGFSGVSAVRNSQFATEPEKITRVVFDLVGTNKFAVSMSADRKSVKVAFEQNAVEGVTFARQGNTDTITINNSISGNVSAKRLYSPDILAFDVAGSKNRVSFTEMPVDGALAKLIKVSQLDAGTVRVAIDLKNDAKYQISTNGKTTTITLSEPTYRNILYNESQSTITLRGVMTDPSQITHNDNYMGKVYTLTFPQDLSAQLGYGTFEINDKVFGGVTVESSGGRTSLKISEKSIYAYKVYHEGNGVVIKAVHPREVYKSIVYIDAGHGGSDPGASGGGMSEKNVNLNIIQKLNAHLENDPNIKVYASRLDDTYPSNVGRATAANGVADIFVSVHQNSMSNSTSNGTEVLYYNHKGETYPKITSEAVARIFQTNLVQDIGTTDRGVVRRPDLIVLNTTTIPAVLVEVGFMSNASDVSKVSTEEGRQIVADSLYRSIKQVFEEYPTGR